MKWEPTDIIRLVALLGGFFLCALGAYLMWLGVGAEGTVDIKSSVLSGTVKTGSAGLFIIFFGFSIVLFVLATLTAKASLASTSLTKRHSKAKAIGQAFSALFIATVGSGALGAFGYGPGFAFLALGLGMMMLFAGGAYLQVAANE